MSTTVRELQVLLLKLVRSGRLSRDSEVMLVVNEDFAELDFLDPQPADPEDDNPKGRLWLMGNSFDPPVSRTEEDDARLLLPRWKTIDPDEGSQECES